MSDDSLFERMIGKRLSGVSLSPDREKVTFMFADNTSHSFRVDGDCCSRSWIEHLEVTCDVPGAILLGVEELCEDRTDDETLNPRNSDDAKDEWERGRSKHECLQVYQTRFNTDRGVIVLEYRNSSNGYYGGYLVAA